MKLNKLNKIFSVTLAILILTLTCACTSTKSTTTSTTTTATTTTASNFPLTVNTSYVYGGNITQTYTAPPSKPKSVIVDGTDMMEFMVYFGLSNLIYGVVGANTTNSLTGQYQATINSLNFITDSSFISTEDLLNAINDGANFILTSNPSAVRETIFTNDMAGLNKLGVSYYYSFGSTFVGSQYASLNYTSTATYSWPEFFAVYQQLGILFGIEDKVDAFIAQQMQVINYVQARANADTSPAPSVMFIYYAGPSGLYGSYDNGLMELMCETCKCNYLHGNWSNETILNLNPDIIICRAGGAGLTQPFDQIPAFASLNAVKNNTVYTSTTIPWTSNSAGLLVANSLVEIAGYIHPDWLLPPATTSTTTSTITTTSTTTATGQ